MMYDGNTELEIFVSNRGEFMNTKKLNLLILATFSLALIALVLPTISNAQGRYTGRYSKRDVSNIITKLERSSDDFSSEFDRQMDNSSINGTDQEDRLNDIVADYEDSLDRLRREFDNNDTWWESRNNVQDVIGEARQVNQMMNNLSFARKLESRWKNMRRDLNKLADTYDLPLLDGSGGGNTDSGNVPSWAVGTFYGRNPQNGGQIIMTINANGSVSISFDNSSFNNATMNGTRLFNNGSEAKVTRIQNGIRTTSVTDGAYIDYYRDSNSTGGGNNNTGGGNVPNWAIGTFSARNPQSGGTITLTISKDGNVVINMDGNTSYATMRGNRFFNAGEEAKVTRLNNGIRTTSVTDGAYIDYYNNSSGGGNNTGGNVPSWAVGSFSGRNPQSGGTIILTISKNGNVSVNMDGNVSYATMRNDRLFNNGAEAKVTKTRNGIRTTSVTDGTYIDYQRIN